MVLFKKLSFAIPFIILVIISLLKLSPFLKDPYAVFSFSFDLLFKQVYFVVLLLLAITSYSICSLFLSQWRYSFPLAIVGSLIPFFFFSYAINLILSLGFLLSLVGGNVLLKDKLKNYVNFQPTKLFISPVRTSAILFLIAASFAFYVISQNQINENGFRVPEPLLDLGIQLNSQNPYALPEKAQQKISPQELQLLRENPQILESYGIDPDILNRVQTSISPSQLAKPLLQQQIQSYIKPYNKFIPIVMAILFFLSLQFLASLLALLLTPLVFLLFIILEKTGYTHFILETRQIKKLVVE